MLRNFFKKKSKNESIYAYMGSIGISPKQMMMYDNALKIIKQYENKEK